MSTATYDTRKYECCAPYFGEVGQEFTRRFRPEFEGSLHNNVDDYASLYEHVVLQADPGAAGVPHAGNAAAQVLSERAYDKRLKKSFGLIRRHVEDPALRDDIDANAMGNGPAAWAIIIAAGTAQQTFLNLTDQDTEWQTCSFIDVGIDERTIPNFRALLDRLNRERPVAQRKSNVEVWQKILQCVRMSGNPDLIKLKATDQLQIPTLLHPPGHPLVGQPNIGATVLHFSERWRSAITEGAIRKQPARSQAAPRGNRVDGMLINTSTTHQSHNDEHQLMQSLNSPLDLFLTNATNRQVATERVCWNCKGLGHLAKDGSGTVICPSPAISRSYAACISALEEARRREGLKKSVRFVRRPQRPSASDARLTDANASEVVTFEVDSLGAVYDSDGRCVAEEIPAGAVIEPADDSPLPHTTSTLDVKIADASSTTLRPIPPAPLPSQTTLDEDFESAFVGGLLTECAAAPRVSSWHMTFISALSCVAIGCAFTMRKMGPAGRMCMLAGLSSSSMLMLSPIRRFNANWMPPLVVDASLGASKVYSSVDFNPRTGAAIDTGATKHASGRVKLFPKRHITIYKPNLVVEIANNTHCKVAFIGSMQLHVRQRDDIHRSTKKRIRLLISDALYVPDLCDITLLSPKALFANEGIRSYFNDARFLRMPDGRIIDFVETERLFILPFDEPDAGAACTAARSGSHASALTGMHASAPANEILAAVPKPTKPLSLDHLHAKFSHQSLDAILRSQHCFAGLDIAHLPVASISKTDCEACIRASMRRHDAPARTGVEFTVFAQCVCSDTCDMGIYSIPFGFRYFLTFLDMATKFLFVYFLRTHTHAEVRQAYLQFMADAKQFMPKGHVELWFTDNGTEFNVSAGVGKDKPGYFANTTDAWLAEYFTRRRFIVPWNPQENPAESTNRVLLRPARATLLHAGKSPRFWPFSIHQAVVVHNAVVSRSRSAVHAMYAPTTGTTVEEPLAKPLSPYVMLYRKPFNARFLEPLFCLCHCKVTNSADLAVLSKPDSRSTPAIHLGLDPRRNGFFVFLIDYKRFTTSAYHDTFFPHEVTYPDLETMSGTVQQNVVSHRLPTEERLEAERPPEPFRAAVPNQDDNDRPQIQRTTTLPSGNTRSSADKQLIAGLSLCAVTGFDAVAVSSVKGKSYALLLKKDVWRPVATPSSTREAMAQDEAGWKAAYRADFEAKVANGAFKYCPRPPSHVTVHPIGWAHKIVWAVDNTIEALRARLVGKGYRQVKGIDFAESYSSTPRLASIRIFLAIVVVLGLETEHCDVVKAFTQNEITDVEHLYVEQPPELPVVMDDKGRPMVLECVMALEGLRQSGHLHQGNHSGTFTAPNDVAVFTQLEYEPNIFVYINGDEKIIVIVWTDDVLFAYNKQAKIRYESFLEKVYGPRWNFKRKGPVQRFAGIEINVDYDEHTASLSLERYIEGVYNRFVPSGHPARTLPAKNKETFDGLSVARDDNERARMEDKPYLAAVASLIWIQSTLRADIAVHVAVLCQFMHDPSPAAYEAVIDLIAYVHYSKSACITYYADSSLWKCPTEYTGDRRLFEHSFGLHAFCDSSWKLRSMGGYLIFLAGGPVDWSSKLIKVPCHSSAEAEVGAGCLMAKSLVFVRHLAVAMGINIDMATPCFIDSEAAILISNNVGVTKRTMHFERWQFYLRHCVQRLSINLIHVVTKRQRADGLTKIVDPTTYRWLFATLFGRQD